MMSGKCCDMEMKIMTTNSEKKLRAAEGFVATRLHYIATHFLEISYKADNMEEFRRDLILWKNNVLMKSPYKPVVCKEDLEFGSTKTFTSEEVSDTLSYDTKCEIKYIDKILGYMIGYVDAISDYMLITDDFDDVKNKIKKDIEKFKKEVEEKGKVEYDDLINGNY